MQYSCIISHQLSPLEQRVPDIQIVIVTNFVVVLSVSIKRVDCNSNLTKFQESIQYILWCATWEKGLYTIYKQPRSRQTCTFSMSNLDIFCLSIYIIIYIDSVSRQWRPWSACPFAQADLGLHCLQIAYGSFSCIACHNCMLLFLHCMSFSCISCIACLVFEILGYLPGMLRLENCATGLTVYWQPFFSFHSKLLYFALGIIRVDAS